GHEIAHRARHEHFAGVGRCSDARADGERDPGELVLVEFAVADVHAYTQRQAEGADTLDDRLGGAYRAGGAVERGEEAVACGVALLTAEARELPADESV